MPIAEHERSHLLRDFGAFIDGQRRPETHGGRHQHIDPSSGEAQADVALAGAQDVDAAVRSARAALPVWRAVPAQQKVQILLRCADLLDEAAVELGTLLALETGAPFNGARGGGGLAAAWIRYYAGWADKLEGQVVSSLTIPGFDYVVPEPYGVIAAVLTWNSPVISIEMKVFPALAAGNTVVLKSPELTPFAAVRVAEIAMAAGLPPGAFNVVPGTGEAGAALVRHPGVDKVTFTGGGATARLVMAGCAETLKPLALELGGKSANLVFEDADLDRAIPMSVMGCFALSGQGCVNPTRMLVAESRYDEVIDRLRAVVGAIRLGRPFDADTTMGPVINEAACRRIVSVLDRAKAEGAGEVLVGGGRADGDLSKGAFVQPTIFGRVDPSSHLAQEEVFGPVLAVSTFKDEASAVAQANSTAYGLGAYLHTRDIDRAHRVAAELEAGCVYINSGMANMTPNAPFGGIKLSGFGSEGGRAGLQEFLRPKTVFVATRPR